METKSAITKMVEHLEQQRGEISIFNIHYAILQSHLRVARALEAEEKAQKSQAPSVLVEEQSQRPVSITGPDGVGNATGTSVPTADKGLVDELKEWFTEMDNWVDVPDMDKKKFREILSRYESKPEVEPSGK